MAVHRQIQPLRLVSARLGITVASMLIMLAVINLTYQRMRQQGGGPLPPARPPVANPPRVPADDERAQAEPEGAAPVADLDPEEAQAFEHESQAVLDRATIIHPIENPAFYRLLRWVSAQSATDLARRDPEAAVFQDLVGHPDAARGKLVQVELSVKTVRSYPADPEKSGGADRLYELWGWPAKGRGWLYEVVTPELPAGFPVAPNVDETVRVYGYFLKLQGYEPADAKPYARPLVAPLIMGRVTGWQPPAPPPQTDSTLSYVIAGAGCAVLLLVIGLWLLGPRRRASQETDLRLPARPQGFAIPEEGRPPEALEPSSFDWVRDVDHQDE